MNMSGCQLHWSDSACDVYEEMRARHRCTKFALNISQVKIYERQNMMVQGNGDEVRVFHRILLYLNQYIIM